MISFVQFCTFLKLGDNWQDVKDEYMVVIWLLVNFISQGEKLKGLQRQMNVGMYLLQWSYQQSSCWRNMGCTTPTTRSLTLDEVNQEVKLAGS